MNISIDLHTHTIASGHAYSTLLENIRMAQEKNMTAMGTSDHARMLPGAFHPIFFQDYKVIPEKVGNIRIFKGIEANIYDFNGHIDVESPVLESVDYIIASLHSHCFTSGSVMDNTDALVAVMENPYVKIIGHPDDSRFPVDYNRLASEAKAAGVALELNNSSLHPRSTRKNGRKNAIQMLKACMAAETRIIVNSDAHIAFDVGNLDAACDLLDDVGFPEALVVNRSLETLTYVLNK